MTILEKLQAKYASIQGIADARNIAEAVAVINGVGGRGANAIADQIYPFYTIHFDANSPHASSYLEDVVCRDGAGVSLPGLDAIQEESLVVPSGQRLAGWSLASDSTVTVSDPYYPSEDTTLYAVYEVETYTLNFSSNGGSGSVEPISVLGSNPFLNSSTYVQNHPDEGIIWPDGRILLEAPEGKAFMGWKIYDDVEDPDGETAFIYWPDMFKEPAYYIPLNSLFFGEFEIGTTEHTMYAHWLPGYTVRLEFGEGTYPDDSVLTCEVGNTIELPSGNNIEPPEGKTFIGWAYTDGADTPDMVTSSSLGYSPESNITLYAVYDELPIVG